MSLSRSCLHCSDHGIKLSTKFAEAYGMKLGDHDKSRVPRVVCGTPRSNLQGLMRSNFPLMPFAILRLRRKPTNLVND